MIKNQKFISALFLLIISTVSISKAQENWPVVSSEQRERDQIMLQIACLKEQLTALGMGLGSFKSAIEQLLRQIGTPVSYKIYQEMKAAREL